ncbi:YtxH domain-containing protein [Cytobacillus sp. FJAT-54145]|uniref:YtxH domain-containing protein n=1 Tax=Cytobacillus spartinae TaxID=3299023 RepID=A0ABW6KGU8_9BACI
MENEDRKNQNDNINSKDFLIGALIGGIVGAVSALVFAPKSGKEIRNDLNLQATSLKERTDKLRENAKVKSTELTEVAKEKTSNIGSMVSKQSSELLNKVRVGKLSEELYEEEANRTAPKNVEDLKRKLEETKQAFDETESRLNQ